MKPEAVVLERRAMPVIHEEFQQSGIALLHFVMPLAERDPRGVDDVQIIGHAVVQSHEAVIEHLNFIELKVHSALPV